MPVNCGLCSLLPSLVMVVQVVVCQLVVFLIMWKIAEEESLGIIQKMPFYLLLVAVSAVVGTTSVPWVLELVQEVKVRGLYPFGNVSPRNRRVFGHS